MFNKLFMYMSAIILAASLPLLLFGCGGGGSAITNVPTYSISGKVSENGVGVSGVNVKLASSTAKSAKTLASTVSLSVVTDSTGTYTFTKLLPGTYTVSSVDTKYGFDEMTVTVNGADTTVPERAVYPVFTVTGKITIDAGTPVVNATVNLYRTSFAIYSTSINGNVFYGTRNAGGVESVRLASVVQTLSTGALGTYSFTGVKSGSYTICPVTSATQVFNWFKVPSRSDTGVVTITESGMVYFYNPEESNNKLSSDRTVIYNIDEPFAVTGSTLDGQDFLASKPGGIVIDF